MNKITFVIFFIVIGGFIYQIMQRKTEFVIKITYRLVKVEKGSPPNRFVNECKAGFFAGLKGLNLDIEPLRYKAGRPGGR